MNEPSPCTRFEEEEVLQLERGEPLDGHAATCPDCSRARARYEHLAGLVATASRADRPPSGWEARVFDRIESLERLSAAPQGPERKHWAAREAETNSPMFGAGRVIGGKYRLTRIIGEGSMGVVWAALDELTTREVALKLMPLLSREMSRRLLREAKACASLSHPNINEVLDVGSLDGSGRLFLVMPLLEGETLKDLLHRQRRLEAPVAVQIARDVARALAAAHTAKIVHRDLKPAKIFLHQETRAEGLVVKVLGFGVNKVLPVKTALAATSRGLPGTPAYMSPEQVGMCDIDERSDIWSLGVVLFEMLSGRRPFQGALQEVILKLMVGEVPRVTTFVRNIDPALDALVASCLERNRDLRMSSAGELTRVLNEYARPNDRSATQAEVPQKGSSLPVTGSPAMRAGEWGSGAVSIGHRPSSARLPSEVSDSFRGSTQPDVGRGGTVKIPLGSQPGPPTVAPPLPLKDATTSTAPMMRAAKPRRPWREDGPADGGVHEQDAAGESLAEVSPKARSSPIFWSVAVGVAAALITFFLCVLVVMNGQPDAPATSTEPVAAPTTQPSPSLTATATLAPPPPQVQTSASAGAMVGKPKPRIKAELPQTASTASAPSITWRNKAADQPEAMSVKKPGERKLIFGDDDLPKMQTPAPLRPCGKLVTTNCQKKCNKLIKTNCQK